MPSKNMQEVLRLIDREAQSRIPVVEFEMAYQARVAMDRIRFAIKHTEQFGPRTDEMREAALQLLDALERLESAERNFQKRFRSLPADGSHPTTVQALNGNGQLGQRDHA